MLKLSDLNANHLILLHWLFTERHVGRAAERAGISQPAASRILGILRDEFRDPLLIRTPKGYALSPVAKTLAPALAQSTATLDGALRNLRPFDPGSSGDIITVASNDYLSAVLSHAWSVNISDRAPKLRSRWLSLHSGTIEDLMTGETLMAALPDLAIAALPEWKRLQDMVVRPLYTDHFVLFGRADNAILTKPELDPATFAAASHVVVSPTGRGHTETDYYLQKLGLSRRIAHRVANFSTAAQLTLSTDSLCVLPQRFCQILNNGTYRPAPFPLKPLSISVAWHSAYTKNEGRQWVHRQFKDYFVLPH